MTSLLPSPRTHAPGDTHHDLRHRRPLVPLAFAGGVAAAASTLVVFMAIGMVGWFLTDGGAHGAPRDGLRIGALGWLLGHGSGVTVEGAAITAMPLGVTLVCAWAIWRIGQRIGDSISGHGPDAQGISDGERDWTVPLASGLFALGYVVTAILAVSVAATPTTDPSTAAVVGWSSALSLFVGAPAVAIGAGRAAIWLAQVPLPVRATLTLARTVLLGWLAVSLAAFAIALIVDFDTAANIMSQLDADAGDTVLFVVLSLLILPNAVAFSGSYLLGPGFTVGTGTLVTPHSAVIGALPMFPMLAARQRPGSVVDRVVAGAAAARRHARGGPGAAAVPDRALGRGRAARLCGRHRGRRRLRGDCRVRRGSGGSGADARRGSAGRRRTPPGGHRLRHRRPAGRAGDDLVAAPDRTRG
jgi:hypothetical protein